MCRLPFVSRWSLSPFCESRGEAGRRTAARLQDPTVPAASPWPYAEGVTRARPEAAAGRPLAADWFAAPRSPEVETAAEAISVVVRTKIQPAPVTSPRGRTRTVAATAERRVSPPPGPMLYEETVPDAAFARYARLPAAFTTSQHAAACDSPTSLMRCNAPAAPTR